LSTCTTPCGHTNRLTTTVPNHESSNPRHVAGSSPSLRSAGAITATSARPDRERVQPRPPRSRKPPDGGPPGSSQAAPSRICRWVAPLIPSRQGRRRQVQRSTHRRGMRRVPMRFLTGTVVLVLRSHRATRTGLSVPDKMLQECMGPPGHYRVVGASLARCSAYSRVLRSITSRASAARMNRSTCTRFLSSAL
jgi:hypothetical protein